MEENKVIFSVTKDETGSSVKLEANGSEELFAVALGIHEIIQECPEVCFFLSTIIMMSKDENFKKQIEEHTIEMPDFDSILKNIK